MPLIKVKTSVANPDRQDTDQLLQQLSASLAQHLGKSESYVMTALEADVPMTFGGSSDPACYVEIKSIGTMSAPQTQAMSATFCQHLSEALGVLPNRIYIEFADAKPSMWGWNGGTFGG